MHYGEKSSPLPWTGESWEKGASFIKEEELPVRAEWDYVCGIIFLPSLFSPKSNTLPAED
jgi:hypothetical protein